MTLLACGPEHSVAYLGSSSIVAIIGEPKVICHPAEKQREVLKSFVMVLRRLNVADETSSPWNN